MYELCVARPVLSPKHEWCRDMQVVIDKLQAGAQQAQAVACKLEAPQNSSHSEEALVSAYAFHTVIKSGALPCVPCLSFHQILCISGFASGHLRCESYPLCPVVTVLHKRKSLLSYFSYLAMQADLPLLSSTAELNESLHNCHMLSLQHKTVHAAAMF